MKVLTAQTKSFPRTVATKYGEKSVIDVWVEGETQTIWRPANDPAIMALRSNQEIHVAKDSKGKISLIDNAPAITQATQTKQEISQVFKPTASAYSLDPDTKKAIAEYVTQQKDLLQFCWGQAEMIEGPCTEDSIEKLAVTLYLSAQRRFNLA